MDTFKSDNTNASIDRKVPRGQKRVNLTPPGFQEGDFPCWILHRKAALKIRITVHTPKNLVKPGVNAVKTHDTIVSMALSLKFMELITNRDEHGLRQLRSWGGDYAMSHLCHSK